MTKGIFLGVVVIVISACTLTGEQELRLNKQLNKYINAVNAGNSMLASALSHSEVVKYYHALGDSLFLIHFSKYKNTNGFISNPEFKEVRKDGNRIEQQLFISYSLNENSSTIDTLFAISEDKGNNWFFIQNSDYHNKKINFGKKLF